MREVRLQTASTEVEKNRKPFYTTLFYWLKFSPSNNRACANIIVWGMPKSLSTLEVRGKLADIGLVTQCCVARGNVRWEGDHIRVVLKPEDSRGITKEVVTRISACLRKIGCRCVLDQVSIAQQQQVQLDVQ